MTFLLAIAAVACAVWGTLLVLRGSLLGGCIGFVLCACCCGRDLLSVDFGPLPVTIDRVALLAIVAAYAVQRRLGHADPKPLSLLDGIVLAFAGVLTASTLVVGLQATAPGEISPAWRLGGGYLIPLVVYWIARQAPLAEGQLRTLSRVLIAFGVYLAVTGLCEAAQLWSFVFPAYVRDPGIGVHFGRARGPMLHSVTYGVYLATALVALSLAVSYAPTRARKLALAALFPLFAAGLYFSYTRSVWMGAAIALLVVLGMSLPHAWRRLTIGGLVAGALVIGLFKMPAIVAFEREGSAADARQSAAMRESFAYVSWLMFQDRPWLGFGFGQFPTAKLAYLADRSTALPLEQIRGYVHHNTYLSLLTETGLVGLGLFLVILFGLGGRAWRLWRDSAQPDWSRRYAPLFLGVLAIYACQMMFHELSYTPLDNSLVFLMAGVLSNLTARSAPSRTPALSTLGSLVPLRRWSMSAG